MAGVGLRVWVWIAFFFFFGASGDMLHFFEGVLQYCAGFALVSDDVLRCCFSLGIGWFGTCRLGLRRRMSCRDGL